MGVPCRITSEAEAVPPQKRTSMLLRPYRLRDERRGYTPAGVACGKVRLASRIDICQNIDFCIGLFLQIRIGDQLMRTMFNIAWRIVSTLLGCLMIFIGLIWMMQGLNIGPSVILRGFMVNDPHWAIYGVILALFGVGQVVWSNTRQARA